MDALVLEKANNIKQRISALQLLSKYILSAGTDDILNDRMSVTIAVMNVHEKHERRTELIKPMGEYANEDMKEIASFIDKMIDDLEKQFQNL